MKTIPHPNSIAITKFWKRYRQILALNDVWGKNADWYEKRVDAFIQATNTTRLKDKGHWNGTDFSSLMINPYG